MMTFLETREMIYGKYTTYEKPLKKPRQQNKLGPTDGKESKGLRSLIKYADSEISFTAEKRRIGL